MSELVMRNGRLSPLNREIYIYDVPDATSGECTELKKFAREHGLTLVQVVPVHPEPTDVMVYFSKDMDPDPLATVYAQATYTVCVRKEGVLVFQTKNYSEMKANQVLTNIITKYSGSPEYTITKEQCNG